MLVTFPQTSAAIQATVFKEYIAGYSWHGYTTKESRGMTSWMNVTEVRPSGANPLICHSDKY